MLRYRPRTGTLLTYTDGRESSTYAQGPEGEDPEEDVSDL